MFEQYKQFLNEGTEGNPEENIFNDYEIDETLTIMEESINMVSLIDEDANEIETDFVIVNEGALEIVNKKDWTKEEKMEKLVALEEAANEGVLAKVKASLTKLGNWLKGLWEKIKATIAAFTMENKKFANTYVPIAKNVDKAGYSYNGFKWKPDYISITDGATKINSVLNEAGLADSIIHQSNVDKLKEGVKKGGEISDKDLKDKFAKALTGKNDLTYGGLKKDIYEGYRGGTSKKEKITGFSAFSLDQMKVYLVGTQKIFDVVKESFITFQNMVNNEIKIADKTEADIKKASEKKEMSEANSLKVKFIQKRVKALNKGIGVGQLINSAKTASIKAMLGEFKGAIAGAIRYGKKGSSAGKEGSKPAGLPAGKETGMTTVNESFDELDMLAFVGMDFNASDFGFEMADPVAE